MTGFVLKLIAICSMLLDHTMKILPMQTIFVNAFGLSADSSRFLVMAILPLGRIAFPIFAFFIAEGCRYTHSAKRYIGRLLVFGLISEVPFRLCFTRLSVQSALSLWPIWTENVFFTLALGALAFFACKALREANHPLLALLPALPLMALAELLHTDYGAWGVLTIFLIYALPEKLPRLLGLGAILSALYLLYVPWNGAELLLLHNPYYLLNWAAAMAAVVLLAFYNGQRGKPLKWMFYIFYPAHLSLLAVYTVLYILPNIQY